jgi:predicted deacetylase
MNFLHSVATVLDAAPSPVVFFFRDDDAGWRDDRLLELIARFAEYGLPLDLVIPAALEPALAGRLRDAPVGLHQHGYAHTNHERTGRKCEFGVVRSESEQRADLEAGRRRLRELLSERVAPIFTPPWNRCTAVTGRCLLELGLTTLSREHRADPLALDGLFELPVRLDVARLSPDALAGGLVAEIARGGPIGVMFHHAVMEPEDMARASELLALLAAHPRAVGRAMAALTPPAAPRARPGAGG